ncbi:OmpA family protein [Sphingomicrobium lutaoense]|uniref:OOP family OmpA-OmpF porin n=1 Tax=Sphingomicrobium lutaoense TaxID=515949 RepID=A0A839YSZ1_9SPHN|nr:OmpA family protein [Sphingomicrobium lutaoense]MBB3763401.1 OOP family OmpA-OmpF porin [Sphingomicrobium lutaoense]
MTARFVPAMIAALMLGACADRDDRDASPDNGLVNETGNTQSILREEVRAEMEPLESEVTQGPRQLLVGFPDGGADLSEEAREALEAFVDEALIESDLPIRLTGHSDTVGSDEANFRAGEARARAVAAFLEERGVDKARIHVISLGEGNPAQPNYLPDGSDNVEGQRANRRVELTVGKDAALDRDQD